MMKNCILKNKLKVSKLDNKYKILEILEKNKSIIIKKHQFNLKMSCQIQRMQCVTEWSINLKWFFDVCQMD